MSLFDRKSGRNMKNYDYPIELDWSHEEMAKVIGCWSVVEACYEGGIAKESFKKAYDAFKEVVPSIGQEKRLGQEFQKLSGYSLYACVQAYKKSDGKRINLGVR